MDEYSLNHFSPLKIHLAMEAGDDIDEFILVALSETIGATQKSKAKDGP